MKRNEQSDYPWQNEEILPRIAAQSLYDRLSDALVNELIAGEARVGRIITQNQAAVILLEHLKKRRDDIIGIRSRIHAFKTERLTISESIDSYRARAMKGDEAALEYIYHVAATACDALAYCEKPGEFERLKLFASRQVVWPVMLSPFPKKQKEELREYALLQVASNAAAPIDLKALDLIVRSQEAACLV